MADHYFSPATIVNFKRDKLLCHPLVIAFINHKWEQTAGFIERVSIVVYMFFFAVVNGLVWVEKS